MKTATTKKPKLSVRMYRQGLGDCFLIAIPGKDGKLFHAMIDCGVVLGTADAAAKMTAVVEDVIRTTGGRIDLLVATHEHWDHVSGFIQAASSFEKLTIGEVWLAWTEDPKSKLGAKLRAERRVAEEALRMAARRLALDGSEEAAHRVDGLVSFFGASSGSTADAFAGLKKMGERKPRYCRPGEPPVTIPDIPEVRFWVLGPPQDEKLIKKSNPGKGDAYGLDAGPGGSQAFLISALTRNMGAAESTGATESIEEPFDAVYSVPLARAERLPFFAQRYFGPAAEGGIYDRKTGKAVRDQSWRRIDSTWMESAETMALQLDSATNNTSLALAIEIVKTGEILLFPGDAQAGNWLSWQDLKWEDVEDPATGRKSHVTGPDLLARTVFYKVGHHGSHNATLKDKGLELMTQDGLVAMIPVDHETAVKKRWTRMPLPDLVERLREKTRGRLLSTDDKMDLGKMKPAGVSDTEWAQFTERVTVTPLFYELNF